MQFLLIFCWLCAVRCAVPVIAFGLCCILLNHIYICLCVSDKLTFSNKNEIIEILLFRWMHFHLLCAIIWCKVADEKHIFIKWIDTKILQYQYHFVTRMWNVFIVNGDDDHRSINIQVFFIIFYLVFIAFYKMNNISINFRIENWTNNQNKFFFRFIFIESYWSCYEFIFFTSKKCLFRIFWKNFFKYTANPIFSKFQQFIVLKSLEFEYQNIFSNIIVRYFYYFLLKWKCSIKATLNKNQRIKIKNTFGMRCDSEFIFIVFTKIKLAAQAVNEYNEEMKVAIRYANVRSFLSFTSICCFCLYQMK